MARKKEFEALQTEIKRLNEVMEEQSIIHHETDRQLEIVRTENNMLMAINKSMAFERDRLSNEITLLKENQLNLLEAISILGKQERGRVVEEIWFRAQNNNVLVNEAAKM